MKLRGTSLNSNPEVKLPPSAKVSLRCLSRYGFVPSFRMRRASPMRTSGIFTKSSGAGSNGIDVAEKLVVDVSSGGDMAGLDRRVVFFEQEHRPVAFVVGDAPV